MSRVRSGGLTILRGLITPLMATHEPPSAF